MDKRIFWKMCKQKFKIMQKGYSRFRKSIFKEYYEEFCILEGYNDFSYELGETMDGYIPKPSKPYLQFALLRIHEKAIKVFREATILMENGSASGAMARWRTLFELSVVSKVLLQYPELAEKYINYSKIDTYKAYKKLYEYRDKLDLVNYNFDNFKEIEQEYNCAKTTFGWNGKNSYEWALNDDIKSANLFELSKAVGLEHFYAYIDEAHMYNHPSTRFLLNDRGAKVSSEEDINYLFSPFEMHLPMQLIVSSLHQVNCSAILGYAQLETTDQEQMKRFLETNAMFPETIIDIVTKKST